MVIFIRSACLIDSTVLLGVMASLTRSTKLSYPEMSEIAWRENNDILLEESGHVEYAVHHESAVKDDASDGKIVWTLRSSVAAVSLCALYVGRNSTKSNCNNMILRLTSDRLPSTALLCRWLPQLYGQRLRCFRQAILAASFEHPRHRSNHAFCWISSRYRRPPPHRVVWLFNSYGRLRICSNRYSLWPSCHRNGYGRCWCWDWRINCTCRVSFCSR